MAAPIRQNNFIGEIPQTSISNNRPIAYPQSVQNTQVVSNRSLPQQPAEGLTPLSSSRVSSTNAMTSYVPRSVPSPSQPQTQLNNGNGNTFFRLAERRS